MWETLCCWQLYSEIITVLILWWWPQVIQCMWNTEKHKTTWFTNCSRSEVSWVDVVALDAFLFTPIQTSGHMWPRPPLKRGLRDRSQMYPQWSHWSPVQKAVHMWSEEDQRGHGGLGPRWNLMAPEVPLSELLTNNTTLLLFYFLKHTMFLCMVLDPTCLGLMFIPGLSWASNGGQISIRLFFDTFPVIIMTSVLHHVLYSSHLLENGYIEVIVVNAGDRNISLWPLNFLKRSNH